MDRLFSRQTCSLLSCMYVMCNITCMHVGVLFALSQSFTLLCWHTVFTVILAYFKKAKKWDRWYGLSMAPITLTKYCACKYNGLSRCGLYAVRCVAMGRSTYYRVSVVQNITRTYQFQFIPVKVLCARIQLKIALRL